MSAGAIAEMGWAKALFNCTGVWGKDVVLDKATAAVLAVLSSSSNSKYIMYINYFIFSLKILFTFLQAVKFPITSTDQHLLFVILLFYKFCHVQVIANFLKKCL